MWALSEDFRRDFDRDESQKFVDRFGYRKRLLEDRDDEGKVIEFGSQSDRVQRSERVIGNAPGVLPLFLLRHLLPISVTLHKADLAIDLPPCKQIKHAIAPSPEQAKRFNRLQEALVQQIRKDQFDEEVAGKLWGQLAELPSYLDRATEDTGNTQRGAFEIRYPENAGSLSNRLVTSQAPFPSGALLPKEEWMLDLVESELAEGRKVMVFCWHVNMLPRIASLISARIGGPVPILNADKVPTGKRQAWIEKEIVKKGRRVMVCNPVAIQTGLNNLVHFSSEIWMENPACNPVTFRQAIGRVDRIGQPLDTRIHFAIYKDTLQEQLYDLLMAKVAVSVSTDGLDPESALQAAGVGQDEYFAGLSIGKQLWRMFSSFEAAA
jgi:SNF2 family DNA or RNA helicase